MNIGIGTNCINMQKKEFFLLDSPCLNLPIFKEMNVIKKKKETQTEVYSRIMNEAVKHGFEKENCSMITLLLKPGSTIKEKQLLKQVHELLAPINRTYMAVVEPVIGEPELYNLAGYYYHENKPWFHVHILIQEYGTELRELAASWFRLAGKSSKRLFHCSHIKDSLSATVNYMTKWFEVKRDGHPQYHIHLAKPAVQSQESEIDFFNPMERTKVEQPINWYTRLPIQIRKNFNKFKSITWVCFSILLESIRKLE